jgi:hypothetical protein
MNDSMSILLATTILALGGLGLYMYKSSDDDKKEGEDDVYNEDSIFGNGFWGFTNDKEDDNNKEDNNIIEEFEDEDYKPRKRGAKTHRNRKSNSASKRRY